MRAFHIIVTPVNPRWISILLRNQFPVSSVLASTQICFFFCTDCTCPQVFPDEIWPEFSQPWPQKQCYLPYLHCFLLGYPHSIYFYLLLKPVNYVKRRNINTSSFFYSILLFLWDELFFTYAKSETLFSVFVCFSGDLLSVWFLSISKFLLRSLSLPQSCSYISDAISAPVCLCVNVFSFSVFADRAHCVGCNRRTA